MHLCDRPLPVGIKHHRPYKINPFSAHDSPPKWCGSSPRPGTQCGNDLQVKGRLASSSIKPEKLQLHDASFLWQETGQQWLRHAKCLMEKFELQMINQCSGNFITFSFINFSNCLFTELYIWKNLENLYFSHSSFISNILTLVCIFCKSSFIKFNLISYFTFLKMCVTT